MEVRKRLADPFTATRPGDEAAVAANGLFHLINRIIRTGNFTSHIRSKHGEIIMVIPHGKDLGRRKLQTAGKLLEDGALMVVHMTKAQINGIALIAEGRSFLAELLKDDEHLFHLLIVLSHEAGHAAIGLSFDAEDLMGFQDITEGVEGVGSLLAEIIVILPAAIVPLMDFFPAMRVRLVDLSFGKQEEIRLYLARNNIQTKAGLMNVAAGIQRPETTVFPEAEEAVKEFIADIAIFLPVDNRPVKVQGEKANDI